MLVEVAVLPARALLDAIAIAITSRRDSASVRTTLFHNLLARLYWSLALSAVVVKQHARLARFGLALTFRVVDGVNIANVIP
jgi:hypothetical protein